jgi:uncharacterized protein (TIGR01777 family)
VRRTPRGGEIGWDPDAGRLDPADLDGIGAVVHLAGENIGARWTAARKRRIRESRVRGTRLLSEALARARRPPTTLVSISAVGIYGDRGDELLTETSPVGPTADFLVRVATEWEAATEPARDAGIRVVLPRLGTVLDRNGGALARMLPPFRLGVGGRLGDGRQWMSWIALDDAVAVITRALEDPALSGPVNATAPTPVRNAEFTAALGRALRRPAVMPVPAAALRLVFGEMADVVLLGSSRAVPARLAEAGFSFRYPTIDAALRRALG